MTGETELLSASADETSEAEVFTLMVEGGAEAASAQADGRSCEGQRQRT